MNVCAVLIHLYFGPTQTPDPIQNCIYFTALFTQFGRFVFFLK